MKLNQKSIMDFCYNSMTILVLHNGYFRFLRNSFPGKNLRLFLDFSQEINFQVSHMIIFRRQFKNLSKIDIIKRYWFFAMFISQEFTTNQSNIFEKTFEIVHVQSYTYNYKRWIFCDSLQCIQQTKS